MTALTTGEEIDPKKEAKVRLEICEILHELYMKSKDLERIDIIGKIQKEILKNIK